MAMPIEPCSGLAGSQNIRRPLAASRVTAPAPAALRRLDMPMPTIRGSVVSELSVEVMRVKFEPSGREKSRVSQTLRATSTGQGR
ncbi:hypothetical protein D3C72_2275160 [compost metagenome]